MFYKIGALKNFSKFTKRTSVTEFFLIKLQGDAVSGKPAVEGYENLSSFFLDFVLGMAASDICRLS